MTDYTGVPAVTPFQEGECEWCGVTEGTCGKMLNRKPGEPLKCWRFVTPHSLEVFEQKYGKEPHEGVDSF